MKPTRLIAFVAAAASAVLVASIVRSSFEMSLLKGLLATTDTWWGITTMVDLYAGLGVIGAWIWHRERRAGRVVAWAVALGLLGNLATLAYLASAAWRSDSVHELVHGRPSP